MARLLDRYRESIRPELQRDLGLRNLHEVPQLEKVVVNVGIGAAIGNDAIVDHTVRDIASATGQRCGGGDGFSFFANAADVVSRLASASEN